MKYRFSFIRIRFFTMGLSLVLLIAMYALIVAQGGFNLGIDFKPGLSFTLQIDPAKHAGIEDVRKAVAGLKDAQLQATGDEAASQFVLRIRSDAQNQNFRAAKAAEVTKALDGRFGVGATKILANNVVGAKFSQTLTQQTILLVSLALLLILFYIWIRFRLGYAMGAVVSTLQVALLMLGFIGITQMEFTSTTIAALLTIIGYCLNDTVVVFDRIRENEKTMAEKPLAFIIDTSIWQTLSRTIVTSFTVFIAVLSIAIFTSGEIKNFAIAFIVGVVVGTYSSIFIAAPILLQWRAGEVRRRLRRDAAGKGLVAGQIATDQATVSTTIEVDADAVAEEIRRTKKDKKKY
jgi:preprotein translocase subunit SecF